LEIAGVDKDCRVRGFVPVVHAATESRPDEVDTIVAAKAVSNALSHLKFKSEIVGLNLDMSRLNLLPTRSPLAVFNLVDAINGDGRLAPFVPARLDALGLAYTGCGTGAWLDTLSKIGTKLKLAHAGLPTPTWSADGQGLDPFKRVIVKAVWEHGSLGLDDISVMSGAQAGRAILEQKSRWKTDYFAEVFVDGREFNVSLLEGPARIEVLPLAEIMFEGLPAKAPKILAYNAKWATDSEAYVGTTRRFGLEGEEPALADELSKLAMECWNLFQLQSYARVDFRVDRSGKPYILEVNMNPCLSPDAGFAAAAAERGLSYRELVGLIVEVAIARGTKFRASSQAQSDVQL
jgi:D-alanine-D-alanine ligase